MRTAVGVASGVLLAAGSAVVLGDYALSGLVPWTAAVVVPAIIAAAMILAGGGEPIRFWLLTGPLAGASLGWGAWIATGRGLSPIPAAVWAAIALAVAWPLACAGLLWTRRAGIS